MARFDEFEGMLEREKYTEDDLKAMTAELNMRGCSGLEFSLADGDITLEKCNSKELKRLVIPNQVYWISTNCFQDCGLEHVVLPKNLEYLAPGAFDGCSNLQSCKIPDGVTKISRRVFKNCTSLERLVLPEELDNLGSEAFYGCAKLKEIEIPENVEEIGSRCFYLCNDLTDVTLPEYIEVIPAHCFYGCTSLTRMYIPENVSMLDEECFGGCINLKEIEIAGYISSFKNPFKGCTGLSTVYLHNLRDYKAVEKVLQALPQNIKLVTNKGNKYTKG